MNQQKFNSILIANRGEIACRVIRTAKSLGYKTIAVYSDADANALHVASADNAVCIGPASVGESYLNIDNIIQAAKDTGAQSIHPGYGFLSENADFAKTCADSGIVFIGPNIEAIALMGNKAESKRQMLDAGISCVAGYQGKEQDDATLINEAESIGFPIMVKAAAGGGGRGMRLVESIENIENAIQLARNEAQNAFGNGELIIEKAVINPRHVEIQVFADNHGNYLYFGERDCSIQRRHQKIIEEAPCPVLDNELRMAMGKEAVKVARSVNYSGAGTVEFLLDTSGDTPAFYFLEMNTRLQVEHPVTEMITGLDLVALQIQVAQGEPLGFEQDDIELYGHAIEVRLYAEDCAQQFLPASGNIAYWKSAENATDNTIRVDTGVQTGDQISPFYDPMVAKIITWGEGREQARLKLIQTLRRNLLFGTVTNRDFLIDCLKQPKFIDAEADTAFIEQVFPNNKWQPPVPREVDSAIAAVIDVNLDYQRSIAASLINHDVLKNWSSISSLASIKHWRARSANHDATDFELKIIANPINTNQYLVKGELETSIVVQTMDVDSATLMVDDIRVEVFFYSDNNGTLYLSHNDNTLLFDNIDLQLSGAGASGDNSKIIAPMHGIILEIMVAEGDSVKTGQPLLVLEAMKMHHQVLAQTDAVIETIFAEEDKQVAADDLLIQLDIS